MGSNMRCAKEGVHAPPQALCPLFFQQREKETILIYGCIVREGCAVFTA
jgi:hypothetical protein